MSDTESKVYFIKKPFGKNVPDLRPGEVDEALHMDRSPSAECTGRFTSYNKFGAFAGSGSMGVEGFKSLIEISEQEFNRLCNPYICGQDEILLSELPEDADLSKLEWSWAFPDDSLRGHIIHCDSEGSITRYLIPRAVSQLIIGIRDDVPVINASKISRLAADIQLLARG